jgi:SAM-dependent methyltransferase
MKAVSDPVNPQTEEVVARGWARAAGAWVKHRVMVPVFVRILDWWYGLDSEGDIQLKDLGIDPTDRQLYRPSSWFTMRDLSAVVPLTDEDVFVDFGSGKGRMVFLAALRPFRRVIGVELSDVLNEIARQNVERNRGKLRCKNIEIVTSDVLEYPIPADMTIAYFFNPFVGDIFKRVIANIHASYQAHPRKLWIVYMSSRPNAHLEASDWLQSVAKWGNCHCYTPRAALPASPQAVAAP